MARRLTGCAAESEALGAMRAQELMDFAVAHPDGFTQAEFMRGREWARASFVNAVRRLRRNQREDSMTLVCDQVGTYNLVSRGEDAQAWAACRLLTLEHQAETMLYVAESIDCAVDRATAEGHRAYLMKRHMSRLLEDIAEMDKLPTLF